MLKAERYSEGIVSKRIEILIFISVFISSITFFKEPFEGYLHYAIFLFLLPSFVMRYGYPNFLLKIIAILGVVGVINVYAGNCDTYSFIKVYGGMILSVSFYNYVINYYEFSLDKIFKTYLKWAYWISILGFVQVVSYWVGFQPGYDFRWIFNKWGLAPGGIVGIRVNSVFSEASQFAIVLSPAVYIGIYNLIHKESYVLSRFQSMVVLVAVVLSSSSTGYIGILIAFLLASNSINLKYVVIGLIATTGIGLLLYNNVQEFRIRVDSSVNLWYYRDYGIENTNTSSFVLYNNFHIASENLKEHPFFGTGLGSHETAYEKYSLTKTVISYDFEFNKQDGNSMFVRLMSETGLVGIVTFILLLIKGYVGEQTSAELMEYRLLSQGILMILLLYLLRQGNYFLNGFPFFVLLYYYNKVLYNNKSEELRLDNDEVLNEMETTT